jgi:hypothetical protein
MTNGIEQYRATQQDGQQPFVSIDIRDTLLSAEKEFDRMYADRMKHVETMSTSEIEQYQEALDTFLKAMNNSAADYLAWEDEARQHPEVSEVTKEEHKIAFIKKWLGVSAASYLGAVALFFAEKNTPGVLALLGGTMAAGTAYVGVALQLYEPEYSVVFRRRMDLLRSYEGELRQVIHDRKNIRV